MLHLLATLQLVATPGSEPDAFESRITPEVLVVQSAGPAVVYLRTNVPMSRRDWWGRIIEGVQQGSGSGVVIFEDGFIVTNHHVIRGAESIQVQFDPTYDPQVYEARVVSAHPQEDLALLKVEGSRPFPTVPLGRSDDLMIGERVIAIGNPYGQTHTVSAGIISGLHRDVRTAGIHFRNLIQTDASINPGNSGGPLLNINGELIGINTAMNTEAENIGFAIPVDHVKGVLEDHLLSPDASLAWLGYDVDLGELVVTEVLPGSPADLGGLRPRDRILAIDDRAVDDAAAYRLARLSLEPGRSVRMSVRAQAAGAADGTRELTLTGWDRVDGILYERLGVRAKPITLGVRRPENTVQVVTVREGGPADRLGLREGDVLRYVRPHGYSRPYPVPDTGSFAFLLNQLPPETALDVELWRDEDGNRVLERRADYSEVFTGTLTLD